MNKTRVILYSPGYGAGWTTWNTSNDEMSQYLLEQPDIIKALQANKPVTKDMLDKISHYCKETWGISPSLSGASNLEMMEVCGQIHIKVHDGYETVVKNEF